MGPAAARRGAYVWVDSFCNARRRHSKTGHISPLQHEQRLTNKTKAN
jgi:hypothetical protein